MSTTDGNAPVGSCGCTYNKPACADGYRLFSEAYQARAASETTAILSAKGARDAIEAAVNTADDWMRHYWPQHTLPWDGRAQDDPDAPAIRIQAESDLAEDFLSLIRLLEDIDLIARHEGAERAISAIRSMIADEFTGLNTKGYRFPQRGTTVA